MRLAPPVPETGAMRDIALCVRPRAHLRWLRARGSIEKHVGTACRRGRGGHAPAQSDGPRGIAGPRRTQPVVLARLRITAPNGAPAVGALVGQRALREEVRSGAGGTHRIEVGW